jgi:hypothetical protein
VETLRQIVISPIRGILSFRFIGFAVVFFFFFYLFLVLTIPILQVLSCPNFECLEPVKPIITEPFDTIYKWITASLILLSFGFLSRPVLERHFRQGQIPTLIFYGFVFVISLLWFFYTNCSNSNAIISIFVSAAGVFGVK